MPRRIVHRLNARLERLLPEQRLFLKSVDKTRFVRMSPLSQLMTLGGFLVLFGWCVLTTSILLIDGLSSGSADDQERRARIAFETRLEDLAGERDARAAEALAAQKRFALAMDQVSRMQSALLASEERRRELETGINVIQTTLRRAMTERDDARRELAALAETGARDQASQRARGHDTALTLDVLARTLGETAAERDARAREAREAQMAAERAELERRLLAERHDAIFETLEDAVSISMEPLDKMFRQAGINPKTVLEQVRRGYSGSGGPLVPVTLSTMGDIDDGARRAADILERLDRLNLYRLAAEKMPFDMPVRAAHRFTSPFGYRWGRLHAGIDLAAPVGTPIYVTADGVVKFAGRQSGYGLVIEITHANGLETRYGHLSRIRVSKGQKVSRGDRIGDMGNTGRSTGPHLHYEVRVGGKPVNPMTFIKAARNVF
ncbi:M23 family metallopeptidase [Phaeovulum vinaykumarii]|uniref:Murein DD-endopeptidase MepM and murein hydrolase activator NlpD, contain LysM domain n=1 Tax=Phaeovulum vinaykumarii TaxID=407234 RepID=A0A1N7MG21_9RHOB|nr:M23 family metallopeptidase [Phaeovulum vinaykumarii]SIS84977.1 Murein DD-endopeptidase MepM and murein hydrolase activator NlpD, contain LysM domain [Phaeovulum vinaykumarii]SOC12035.1 murein DD-endopeptidase MepM/ murein hydrolase activator NlpD [Phaeovulum vinaykumarii]